MNMAEFVPKLLCYFILLYGDFISLEGTISCWYTLYFWEVGKCCCYFQHVFITLFCSYLHCSQVSVSADIVHQNWNFCLWIIVTLQQEMWSEINKCILLWWNWFPIDIYSNCFSCFPIVFFGLSLIKRKGYENKENDHQRKKRKNGLMF